MFLYAFTIYMQCLGTIKNLIALEDFEVPSLKFFTWFSPDFFEMLVDNFSPMTTKTDFA